MKCRLTTVKEAVERDDARGHIDNWLSHIEEDLDLRRPVELEGNGKEDELQVIREYLEVD